MSKQTEANPKVISPQASAWIEQAKVIVAYPEDFGMTRRDVRGLSQSIAAIAGAAQMPALTHALKVA